MVAAPRERSPLLRRLLGAPGAAPRKACAVGGIAIAALLWSAAVLADDIPPPPPTTTTDAPPPDRYAPAPRPAPPKKTASVTHAAPRPKVRSYTPPVARPPTTSIRPSKPVRRAKVVQRPRKKAVRKPKPAAITLAPIAHVLAASRLPLPAARADKPPYLWLAGFSFAILAVAGLSLQVLTVRYFRPELQ